MVGRTGARHWLLYIVIQEIQKIIGLQKEQWETVVPFFIAYNNQYVFIPVMGTITNLHFLWKFIYFL